MQKYIKSYFLGIFLMMAGCSTTYEAQPISNFEISYRNENYVVPSGEIWKLSWVSPYESGEIFPAYDVRVLGEVYTSIDRYTRIDHYSRDSERMMNIHAQLHGPATIWINEKTEFYIANKRINIQVETYKIRY
jgi:hypothetical protein